MAKIKTKPIKANWRKDWPWFPDHPKKRKIIWIVTYWLLRPDEDDQEEDPLLTKPLQALFDWAGEIATSSQIFDYGLKLKVFSKYVDIGNNRKKSIYTLAKPENIEKYIAHQQISTLLPDFHIRFIDTEVFDEWFLANFLPHIKLDKENPWINLDAHQILYQWGTTGLRALKLADLVTELLKKFYENILSHNEINLINQKASKARVITEKTVTLQTKPLWDKVIELGGYVGPPTPHPKEMEDRYNFPKSLFPENLTLAELKKIKSNREIDSSSEIDYMIIRDVETLLFLELKDLVEMYNDKRCNNLECRYPLPLRTAGNERNKKRYCSPQSPQYDECRKSRDRKRQHDHKLRTIGKSPA